MASGELSWRLQRAHILIWVASLVPAREEKEAAGQAALPRRSAAVGRREREQVSAEESEPADAARLQSVLVRQLFA